MTIPAVGPITALTWVLEVGDVKRFSSIKKAISYCGLCGAEKSSADTIKRTPFLAGRTEKANSKTIRDLIRWHYLNSPIISFISAHGL